MSPKDPNLARLLLDGRHLHEAGPLTNKVGSGLVNSPHQGYGVNPDPVSNNPELTDQ